MHPPSVSQQVFAGRYAPERELGHGGRATVYLAQDLALRRRVALRVPRGDLATSLGRDRFLRDIEITSRLTPRSDGVS